MSSKFQNWAMHSAGFLILSQNSCTLKIMNQEKFAQAKKPIFNQVTSNFFIIQNANNYLHINSLYGYLHNKNIYLHLIG